MRDRKRTETGDAPDTLLDGPLHETLDLSAYAYNRLRENAIGTIRELISRTPRDLLMTRNTGKVTVAEIVDKLAKHGLTLRDEDHL